MKGSFEVDDFELVDKCPFCGSPHKSYQSPLDDKFCVYKCDKCGLYYVNYWFSPKGMKKYWSDYLNTVHRFDQELFRKRQLMYELDFAFVKPFLPENAHVLDIGCSEGLFLDHFKNAGCQCAGVEFGEEAAKAASKKYRVFHGDFPNLDIRDKYDLIIYRGVLQYVHNPAPYLNKTISLLKPGGLIYIIQPNMASFCHNLYKDKFSLHLSPADCIGYDKNVLEKFLRGRCVNIAEKCFYEETPYAEVEKDILRVADAIKKKRTGEKITEFGPPFWGNMLSIIFKKI